ncbi:MAG: hypothetical protein SO062_08575, partial [Sodaliphilus sp.]|nr:hypothetical protein [Sodaliphilus sp.]
PGRDDHQHRHRRQLHRVEQRPLRRSPPQIIPLTLPKGTIFPHSPQKKHNQENKPQKQATKISSNIRTLNTLQQKPPKEPSL